MADWLTIAAAAVGGSLAIVGAGASDHWRRRHELATRWDTFRIQATSEYGGQMKQSLTTASHDVSVAARTAASPAYEKVRLLCGAEVIGAADALRYAAGAFTERLQTLDADGHEGPTVEHDADGNAITLSLSASRAQAAAYDALNRFYAATRKELGIDPIDRDLTTPHPAASIDEK